MKSVLNLKIIIMKQRFAKNQFSISFNPELSHSNKGEISAGDFFAGGGGVTRALYNMPDVHVKWVLNHDKKAIYTNMFHHKGIKHYWADIFVQDEHEMDPVDILWASIECTQHSRAKGGSTKNIGSYMMGWELIRYLAYLQPLVIGIENVTEFKKWGPINDKGYPIKSKIGAEFERWKSTIINMGYKYKESIRNSADDGLPTRRIRYFAFFYRDGINIDFPDFTHNKTGSENKKQWVPCKNHIDLDNPGISIFGRKYNTTLPKHLRRSLCKNTLRRIAGGIKKYVPEFNSFICQYYGNTDQTQSLKQPLNAVTTKDRHQLIQFRGQSIEAPLNTVTTANRHQLITFEKLKFIQDHCHSDNYNLLDDPLNTQLSRQTKQFISAYYNSNGAPEYNNHSLNNPLFSITTQEKFSLISINEKIQFISSYFNSSGNPGSQNQSIDSPINTILTGANKKSLITVLANFDIKARFLTKEELSSCSTFPKDYFSKPGLNLSNKDAIKLIGNAVPPEWARILISPVIKSIKSYKHKNPLLSQTFKKTGSF